PAVVDMPAGFAPMLGTGGIFVAAGVPRGAVPPTVTSSLPTAPAVPSRPPPTPRDTAKELAKRQVAPPAQTKSPPPPAPTPPPPRTDRGTTPPPPTAPTSHRRLDPRRRSHHPMPKAQQSLVHLRSGKLPSNFRPHQLGKAPAPLSRSR